MALTEAEKVRTRHHLGYLGVAQASTFALGVPAAIETSFMLENAFGLILPQTEPLVRQLLDNLDSIEQQILDDQELLAVDQVDEIKIRSDEYEQLLKRYFYWRNGLANAFGVIPNPFDKRFTSWGGPGAGGINITVQH